MEIAIGTNKITGRDVVIDAARHVYIEGMSGVGKSTALVNLFIHHIRQGHGGLFIEPHGEAADQIARLIPKSRMRDFVWIDPGAPYVPGLNIFAYRDPMERERFECYVRTIIDASPDVFHTIARPAIEQQGDETNATLLIKQSLARWGTQRRDVEANITRGFAAY